jgi:hypothetical protein
VLSQKIAAALLISLWAASAQTSLPELRTEPIGGGSIFHVRNTASQPLTAFLIELVNYPGSSYSFWQDDVSHAPLAPGGEQSIQVTNMTVGAVPDYVKMQAALYADGTSSGIPEKVTQLVERRRFSLETLRTLIDRLEKAQSTNTPKASVIADLKQWASPRQPSIKPPPAVLSPIRPPRSIHTRSKKRLPGSIPPNGEPPQTRLAHSILRC